MTDMVHLFVFYLLVGNCTIFALREIGAISDMHPSYNTIWYWMIDVLVWPLIVLAAYIGLDDDDMETFS